MAKRTKERPLSSDPADAEEGGLLDDFDGVIDSMEAVMWDYGGKEDDEGNPIPDSPALKLTIRPDDADEDDDPEEVYLSAGSASRVRASKDGKRFVAGPKNETGKGLHKNTNAVLFLASLVNAGFPAKKLDDYSNAEGLHAHFVRVPQPKRSGLVADAEDEDGNKRQRTVLNVSEIHDMKGKKRTKAGTKKKKAKEPEPDDEEDEEEEGEEEESEDEEEDEDSSDEATTEAEAAIEELLKDKRYAKKGIPADELAQLVFQKVRKSSNKKAILELVQEDDWLEDEDRPFTYEDDKITK